MTSGSSGHIHLIRRMETVSRLDDDDRRVLRELPMPTRWVTANSDILREGQEPKDCCVVLSGIAARCKVVSGGRRQIVSFHFLGDIPDLQGLLLRKLDHHLTVLTKTQIGIISYDAIRAISHARPNLGDAFHRQSLIEGSIFREWIANVGRRTALERVSHIFCECFERMRVVGLTEGETFDLPITQSDLADALGLSNVHINRTMQELKKADLISSRNKVYTILNWHRLREVAGFDNAYLHLLRPSTT